MEKFCIFAARNTNDMDNILRLELEKAHFENAYKAEIVINYNIAKELEGLDTKEGNRIFETLLFKGAITTLKDGVVGSWKEDLHNYAMQLMSTKNNSYRQVRAVCSAIFTITVKDVEVLQWI